MTTPRVSLKSKEKPATFEREKMTTHRIHAYCDCGGEWKSTGYGITCMETAWAHKCDKCGAERYFDHNYPRIEHTPA